MKRTRSALIALGFVVVTALGSGVLAGCSGGDPEPRIAPSSPASASTSDSPAASSARGPVATVRAWVDAQNAAMRTGDSSRVRALGTSDCESCAGLVDPIDKVYEAGGFFQTRGWKVDAAELAHKQAASAKVNVALTIRGGKTLQSKGGKLVRYRPDKRIAVFRLADDGDRWRVSFIGFLS